MAREYEPLGSERFIINYEYYVTGEVGNTEYLINLCKDLNFSPIRSFHFTLFYLGSEKAVQEALGKHGVEDRRKAFVSIRAKVGETIDRSSHRSFNARGISIDTLGSMFFPSRVLMLDVPESLKSYRQNLQETYESALVNLGVDRHAYEAKSWSLFLPHITLGKGRLREEIEVDIPIVLNNFKITARK